MKQIQKFLKGSDVVIPPGEYILDSLTNLGDFVSEEERDQLQADSIVSIDNNTFIFFNSCGNLFKDSDTPYQLPHGWVVLKNVANIGFRPHTPRYITMDDYWALNFKGSVLRFFTKGGYNFSVYSYLGTTKHHSRPEGTIELLIKQHERESKMFDINNFSFDQLLRENRQAAKEAEDRLAKALEDMQALKDEVSKKPELPEDIVELLDEAKDFMRKLQRVLDNHGYEVY